MQITPSFGKFEMLGVTDASVPPPVRLISRTHGESPDPQAFTAEQSCSGCGLEQEVFLLFLSFATLLPAIMRNGINAKPQIIARNDLLFTVHLASN
jgi:hypothetical protein